MALVEDHALGLENDPAEALLHEWRFKVATLLNLLAGGLLATRTFTLTASAGSTVVLDDRVNVNSLVLWQPLTANAANEFAGMVELDTPPMYASAQADGSFTLAHSSTSSTDRTFRYLVLG